VDRALSILRTELARTLRLLGAAEIAELPDRLVTLSDSARR
jgi:isopentenyl diphosphate isomerase/L-lactate dehydrogenase-like FMN-dependent dehydrogenase